MNNTTAQKNVKVKALANWGMIKEGEIFEARLSPSWQKNVEKVEFLALPKWTMHPLLLLSGEKFVNVGNYKKFEIV
jgi:hypothetical protein